MLYSRRIDPRALKRAKDTVARTLQRSGDLYQLKSLLNGETLEPVTLYAQSVFTPAAEWLLPRPGTDEQDLVMAYEAFVEQDLAKTRHSGRVPEKIVYPWASTRVRGLLNAASRTTHWFTPAARLVALARYCPGAVVESDYSSHTYTANVGEYLLSVSPTSIYSNSRQEYITPSVHPLDLDAAVMLIPERTTRLQLFTVLHLLLTRSDRSTLPCLSILNEAVELGVTTCMEIRDALTQYASRRALNKYSGQDLHTARERSVEEAMQVLSSESTHMLRELYPALVPTLFSSKEFSNTFGSPSATAKPRKVRESTLDRWAEKIRDRAFALTD